MVGVRGISEVLESRVADAANWSAKSWLEGLELTNPVLVALSREAVFSAVKATEGSAVKATEGVAAAGRVSEKLKIDAAKERGRAQLETLIQELGKETDDGPALPKSALLDLLQGAAAQLASATLTAAEAPVPEDFDGLEFYLTSVTPSALRLALSAQNLGGLTDQVWAGVHKLRAGAKQDALVLQEKFQQDGAGLMSYSGLSEFFSGLEGKIGAPDANVEAAMAADHCKRPDSHQQFTTKNYEITTTSEEEWLFVASPEGRTFPEEMKLNRALEMQQQNVLDPKDDLAKLLRSGARKRTPLGRTAIEELVKAKNDQLDRLGEPPLRVYEAYGARLYTGPLFQKYVRGPQPRGPLHRESLNASPPPWQAGWRLH